MSVVTEYLDDHKVEFVTFDHEPVTSALEEARTLGVTPVHVAKSVVLWTPGRFAIAVLPASRRLDLHRASEEIGSEVRLATEREIAEAFPMFELGAIPPFSALVGAPIFVDREIVRQQRIVFAAGKQNESVEIEVSDLLDSKNVAVAVLSESYPLYETGWRDP